MAQQLIDLIAPADSLPVGAAKINDNFTELYALKLDASSYTAADVLAKLLTVDGAVSGLDAALLEGLSSAAFLQVSTYQALTPTWSAAHIFSVTPTVPDSSWTYAKIQDVSATARVLGRVTAGAGVIEELTAAQVGALLSYTNITLGTVADARLSSNVPLKNTAAAIAAPWNFTTKQQVFGTTTANIALVPGLADTGASIHAYEHIRNHRVAAEPFWISVRVNGSYAAPTTILSGNSLGEFLFGGYDGATMQAASARMWMSATEDWVAGSAYGSQLNVQTTTTGSTTKGTRLVLGGNSTGGYAQVPSGGPTQPGLGFLSSSTSGVHLIATNHIGLGTNATLALGIDATQRIYGKALHNNASSPTGTSLQYIASGTYTPTLTNTTNIAASTAFQCQWMRVGNVVTVSGRVSVDPTGVGQAILGISLPLASNLGAVEDCSGAACASGVAGQSAAIWGDATNDRAAMEWVAVDLSNQGMSFTFTYEII